LRVTLKAWFQINSCWCISCFENYSWLGFLFMLFFI